MAYITALSMRRSVAARMGQADPGDSPSNWDAILVDAVESAYQLILSKLANRGFTAAQRADWVASGAAAVWNRKVALCHFFRDVGLRGGEATDTVAVDAICKCEEELDTLTLADADGEAILPAAGRGRVGYGDVDTTGDRFRLVNDDEDTTSETVL